MYTVAARNPNSENRTPSINKNVSKLEFGSFRQPFCSVFEWLRPNKNKMAVRLDHFRDK